jgi:hypothetical protein
MHCAGASPAIVTRNVFTEAQTANLLPEQTFQLLLTLDQWQASGTLAVQEQKIEEDKLIGTAFIHRRLEPAEDRHAVRIERA